MRTCGPCSWLSFGTFRIRHTCTTSGVQAPFESINYPSTYGHHQEAQRIKNKCIPNVYHSIDQTDYSLLQEPLLPMLIMLRAK